jgi:thioesterase domain-containing protein
MSPAELERYLRRHIPLSKAMQVSVVEASDDAVAIAAPLAPNINHRDTVFGGSASAVAILAAWALLYLRLQRAGITTRLVIQRNEMNYDLPVTGAFVARSSLRAPGEWPRFITLLARRGRARISVCATLEQDGRAVARFTGDFVALNGVGT